MLRLRQYRSLLLLVLVIFTVVALAGCGKAEKQGAKSDTATKRDFKVGFVYVGPPGDAGWTFAHDEAR
ncbi:MAG: BMP family ABC transporter substrate-binding protein, partial [Candidatus Saccharibacteria bacterium]